MYSGVGLVAATVLCGFQEASSFLPSTLPAPAVSRHRYATKVTMAVNEQLPSEAKRYYVRPDRILDVVTSAPQLLLRLGSGALVDGYRCERDLTHRFADVACCWRSCTALNLHLQ